MTELRIDHIESPIGILAIAVHGDTLCALDFADEDAMRARLVERFGAPRFVAAEDPAGHATRLRDYFDGRLDALDPIAVDPGGTPFQRRVWKALRDVPCGQTRSYGDVARAIGSERAVRAVGAANGRNPIGIVIPCHRVVSSDDRLGGYAGGLARKRWLLEHEGALLSLRADGGLAPSPIPPAQSSRRRTL
jgi:methylated-DNA-[protein]-cysteine S-methyltransferase